MRALVRDLARLGVERVRARVAVHALDVDRRRRRAALALLERGAAGDAGRRRAAIQVMREADAEPAEPTAAVVGGARGDVVDAELGAGDLSDDVGDALADLGGGAVHLGSGRRRLESRTRAAE